MIVHVISVIMEGCQEKEKTKIQIPNKQERNKIMKLKSRHKSYTLFTLVAFNCMIAVQIVVTEGRITQDCFQVEQVLHYHVEVV